MTTHYVQHKRFPVLKSRTTLLDTRFDSGFCDPSKKQRKENTLIIFEIRQINK
jgi:hypothetical protein